MQPQNWQEQHVYHWESNGMWTPYLNKYKRLTHVFPSFKMAANIPQLAFSQVFIINLKTNKKMHFSKVSATERWQGVTLRVTAEIKCLRSVWAWGFWEGGGVVCLYIKSLAGLLSLLLYKKKT